MADQSLRQVIEATLMTRNEAGPMPPVMVVTVQGVRTIVALDVEHGNLHDAVRETLRAIGPHISRVEYAAEMWYRSAEAVQLDGRSASEAREGEGILAVEVKANGSHRCATVHIASSDEGAVADWDSYDETGHFGGALLDALTEWTRAR